jgi:hypothetical protein
MSFELNHPIIIFVSKDGTVTFKRLSKPTFHNDSMPAHSVDTMEEAQAIQAALCRQQDDPVTGKTAYALTDFGGTIEDLGEVAAQMREQSARYRAQAI